MLLDLPYKCVMVPESCVECDRGECLPVVHCVEKRQVHHEVIKSKYQRMVNHRDGVGKLGLQ